MNPPVLGQWLQDFGEGKLWIARGISGAKSVPERLRPVKAARLYPEFRGSYDAGEGLTADVRVFAPLGLRSEPGFLPGLIVEATLRASRHWQGEIGYTLGLVPQAGGGSGQPQANSAPVPQEVRQSGAAGVVRGGDFLGISGLPARYIKSSATTNGLSVAAPVAVEPGKPLTLTFVLGYYDPNGYYANQIGSPTELMTTLATQAPQLGKQLDEFISTLPVTGDPKIDEYLRWYISAATLLTKGLRTGEVLTMGYTELNQRDSFWTSGLHVVFWQDLERKMLQESVAGQLPSGKIPTTILPTIDRGDEIDSSEYFVLRVARYYRWYRDRELLNEAWPAVKRAVDYLHSRDVDHVGVPKQGSWWADWKDVPAVEGRTYAPHFALLWSATLAAAAELAVAEHDAPAAARYRALKAEADAFINKPFDQGGMWNGQNYVDLWRDGRKTDYVLEDQTVGTYFDVVPRDRLESIYKRLAASETPWGVRETYPYILGLPVNGPNDRPGNYHDGGIWPYLNFVDVTGRYAHGHAADAERIIHEVGHADLEVEGDYQPGEYLNGDTGQNRGFPIQGWSASLFCAIYFGAFGIERVSDTRIQILVRLANRRDFSTRLLLPDASGVLSSDSGKLMWKYDNQAAGHRMVSVEIFDERGEGGK